MTLDILIDKILSELGLTYTDTLSKNSPILCVDAIYALIIEESIKDASSLLCVSTDSFEQVIRRHFKVYCNKDSKTKWSTYLLGTIEHRKCRVCSNILPYSSFSLDVSKYTDISSICKECDISKNKLYSDNNPDAQKIRSHTHYYNNKADYLARNAQRRALKLQATPPWADLNKIREVYRNCPEGYQVDHIVPLQGELVCGLHVENNLQHLSAIENRQKSNKFIAG